MQKVVNLSSYNYLGLATNSEVLEAGHSALTKYGTGACGSPLLSGMADLHRELELKIAAWLGREDAMLFNSGFGGGFGSLSGVLRKGDAAIMDEKCHLCLLDGAKLAKAKMVFFKHNDPQSLEDAIKATEGRRRLVIVEGVYSMDGDTAKLDKLMPVAKEHKVGVFIDEAHSILAFGEKGRGVADHTASRMISVFSLRPSPRASPTRAASCPAREDCFDTFVTTPTHMASLARCRRWSSPGS